MTGRPDRLRHELSALADGELDPAAAARLLARPDGDPAVADAARQLRQLSADARAAVRRSTPAPSADLLDRLRSMTPTAPVRPPSAWWRGATRAAAAAVLLLAAGVWAGRRWADGSRRPSDDRPSDVIPAVAVAQAEEVHGFCSRLADGLHAAGYPVDLAALAPAVERDLHGGHPYPDLRPIGFRYRGAGPCGKPLPDTVHLLYRSVRPGSVAAVSVFVQGWHGQYPLAAGQVYTVSVATSPFPMLAWRTEHVVYFLLADDADTERRAADLIRGDASPVTRP